MVSLFWSSVILKKVIPTLAATVMLLASCSLCGETGPFPVPTAAPTKKPTCTISFITPQGLSLPVAGPVTFSWTKISKASYYIFYVDLPGGGNVTYNTDKTSRDVYMENYDNGTITFGVQARDVNAEILCQVEVQYTKEVAKPKKEKPAGGPGGEARAAVLSIHLPNRRNRFACCYID